MHKLFRNTSFVGKKALFLPSCHSTNAIASQIISKESNPHGYVVHTDFQTMGRGQRGNNWESEDGKNILVSIILDASFVKPSSFFNLTILTSLAIHDLLLEYLPSDVKIKWPNDLYYQDRKMAGILIENYIRQKTIEWCIIGMGLNINQKQFATHGAISLASVCDQEFERIEILGLWLNKLEARYMQLKQGKIDYLREQYKANLYWKDEVHVFKSNHHYFNGMIEDVDHEGKLKVKLENGFRLFDLKEVIFVR